MIAQTEQEKRILALAEPQAVSLGMDIVRVRVMGGAYGGFCSFDSHSGLFQFGSYRCAPPFLPSPQQPAGTQPCSVENGLW